LTCVDQEKLDRVVQVAGLQSDLDQFPAGLQTEIGEKGVNLSGGQKARVALARTLYVNPDIVLLDDPISALDAQVGRYVFDHAIKEYLADKTVVLVTHQLHLLPEMDHIIVLNDKTVAEQGTYKELMAQSSLLSVLMKDYRLDDDGPVKKQADAKTDKEEDGNNGGIIVEEDKKIGHVTWSVYWHYFQKCGGVPFLVTVTLAALLSSGTQVMTNLWLSWWSSGKYGYTQGFYMQVYAYLGIGQFVFALIINGVFLFGCYRAAKFYHPLALKQLLKAPMGFFDSQPIGRILNRLSKDVESIDQNLWILMFLSTIAFGGALGSLAFLCYVDVRMLYLAVPLMFLYALLLVFYQRSNIEFKRFESTLRSPLYSHVSETLAGISTVKAFGVENNFVLKQRRLMDESNMPFYLRTMAQVWINIRLSILASFLTLGLALVGTATTDISVEFSALIGLALTYTLGFAGQLGLLLFASSQLENELI
jgi:ATP-binding cassette, subfamily C (CFTR/MRP), member 1